MKIFGYNILICKIPKIPMQQFTADYYWKILKDESINDALATKMGEGFEAGMRKAFDIVGLDEKSRPHGRRENEK